MADSMVERRPPLRFFCHRCLLEFEDVLQDYTCPFCASGFIEQLEGDGEGGALSNDDFSDADMSNIGDVSNIDDMGNIDDSDEMHRVTPPIMDDLAFLMSGGRLRGAGSGTGSGNRAGGQGWRHTLMEELVWMIGGGARPATGALTAGAPFVLVGAPGDYVFGGEGLDAVVTQLLGQLEQAGPPPLPRERLAELPSEPVSTEQAAANVACSVCWENFQLGETVSRLECEHVFHSSCITPWLQLHATCPICRRCLLPPADAAPAPPAADAPAPPHPPHPPPQDPQIRISTPRVVIRRTAAGPLEVRRLAPGGVWSVVSPSTSDSAASLTSAASLSSTASVNSTSLNSERDQYNTDMDYD